MNELLALNLERLAEHYQVHSDYLRRVLLLRGVAELSAVTNFSKPASAEELETVFTGMGRQCQDMLERFRKQSHAIDEAVQQAQLVLVVAERLNAALVADLTRTALPPA